MPQSWTPPDIIIMVGESCDEEHYGGHGGIMQKNAFSGASEMNVDSKGNGPIRNRMLDLGIYK